MGVVLLKLAEIRKGTAAPYVLNNIALSQTKYQKLALAGETGSGKTTLLRIIAGLVQPDHGEVIFQNEKVLGPDDKLVAGHPAIAYLSQSFELPKFLRVDQVLTYSNHLSDSDADTIYEICQIGHLLSRKTNELSGGEKQRIAMAKTLIASPSLLLMDEPYSNLDIIHKNILKTVISEVSERLKITCILVSHDPLDVLSWADRIVVLKEGTIVQRGSPEVIYNKPANEYVAGLFGKYNLLDIPGSKKRVMLRPEHFSLTKKKKGAIEATIGSISFFGSYWETEVTFFHHTAVIRTSEASWNVGDTIYITYNAADAWQI